jgi:hypothetical protein
MAISSQRCSWVTTLTAHQKGINFMDITDNSELGALNSNYGVRSVKFPKKIAQNKTIGPLLEQLEKNNMRKHLEVFTSFHTRYCTSPVSLVQVNPLYHLFFFLYM